ncbi:hypothetical protein [Thermoanaerobacterium sp. RBIITD]|uniref:hypothetical protein n=1 Tax=Thermoanaerobacterium sp. RBIITD TaxID=1550240 RepID=UPI000BB7B7D8|nr:hypothetical protein [Thermoanaerobacterium sp. RBIITD]
MNHTIHTIFRVKLSNATPYGYRDSNAYYKLFMKDSRLIGAILIGDISKSTKIKRTIEIGEDLSRVLDYAVNVKDIMEKL